MTALLADDDFEGDEDLEKRFRSDDYSSEDLEITSGSDETEKDIFDEIQKEYVAKKSQQAYDLDAIENAYKGNRSVSKPKPTPNEVVESLDECVHFLENTFNKPLKSIGSSDYTSLQNQDKSKKKGIVSLVRGYLRIFKKKKADSPEPVVAVAAAPTGGNGGYGGGGPFDPPDDLIENLSYSLKKATEGIEHLRSEYNKTKQNLVSLNYELDELKQSESDCECILHGMESKAQTAQGSELIKVDADLKMKKLELQSVQSHIYNNKQLQKDGKERLDVFAGFLEKMLDDTAQLQLAYQRLTGDSGLKYKSIP